MTQKPDKRNVAKAKPPVVPTSANSLEKKMKTTTLFKSIFDSPFRISWSAICVPVSFPVQSAAFSQFPEILMVAY